MYLEKNDKVQRKEDGTDQARQEMDTSFGHVIRIGGLLLAAGS